MPDAVLLGPGDRIDEGTPARPARRRSAATALQQGVVRIHSYGRRHSVVQPYQQGATSKSIGSGVVLPRSGLLMNNSVSYFDPRPGNPVSLGGGRRINSSNMCPTIATRDGAALFAVGASGANHIVPCTAQLTALLLDYGLGLEDAFHRPRIDASARGSIRADPALGAAALSELRKVFEVEVAQLLVFPKLYSCPSGVARDPQAGTCWGISDISSPVAGAATPAPFDLGEDGVKADQPRA